MKKPRRLSRLSILFLLLFTPACRTWFWLDDINAPRVKVVETKDCTCKKAK